MGLNLAQFVIGAGTGYLSGEQQNRTRARQDKRDLMDERLYESNMRRNDAQEQDAQLVRTDRAALRTAARPVVPVDDVSMPASMDNRDVGLPENASLPNGGLTLAGARVGNTRYANRAEADAAAALQNTPEATAKRYADAQRGTGDLAGAAATEANTLKVLRERQAKAADDMMNEIGKGFMTGGWQGGTAILSKSGADGNDYRHEIEPKSGRVQVYQTQRTTGQTRMLGDFSNDNSGMLDAYKQIGSAIAGKPDVAMAHIAAREKTAADLRKEKRDETKADATETRAEAAMIQAQSSTRIAGAAELRASKAGSGGGDKTPSGYRSLPNGDLEAIPGGPATKGKNGEPATREERLRYTSLFQDAGRRMSEAQKALGSLQKDPLYSMAKPGSAQHEEMKGIRDNIEELRTERKTFQSILAGSQSEDKPPSLADAKSKNTAPVAMPKAKAELKSGQVYQTARGLAKWNGTEFEAQ